MRAPMTASPRPGPAEGTAEASASLRRVRIGLWVFCAIAAVLSAVARIDGALVIAAFFVVIPMLVLGFAPDALALGLALLIASYLPIRGSLGKRTVLSTVAALVLVLAGAAALCNRPLDREVRELTRDDHDAAATLPATRQLALRFVTINRPESRRQPRAGAPGQPAAPVRAAFCERLCVHLLYGKVVDSVVVTSVSALGDDIAPDPGEWGMRFLIRQQSPCPRSSINLGLALPQPFVVEEPHDMRFSQMISERMARGECVVSEPARLGEAPVVVEINPYVVPPLRNLGHPTAKTARTLVFPPESAARLTIYSAKDGVLTPAYRRTQVLSYPLLPVLLMGPIATGEGGIGISEGFLRYRRITARFDLHDVLQSKLGLDLSPFIR